MRDNPGLDDRRFALPPGWKAAPSRRRGGVARGVALLAGIVLFASGNHAGSQALATGARGRPSERGEIREISVPPPVEMTRADLYTLSIAPEPQAVLVLCPGLNENGEKLLRQAAWQDFARANHLGLCALSFASPDEETLMGRGYYHVSHGSGDILLQGVRRGFGQDLPILIYGFSGGAHFTASLVNWKPERVLSWCAYSAGWWEAPAALPAATPPGIVACGDLDATRYGASLAFFARGRALARPWTWVSLRTTGHALSGPLDDFVRAYFAVVLRRGPGTANGRSTTGQAASPAEGMWLDVDSKAELSASQATAQPTLAAWLPDRSLAPLWNRLHAP